ncbi:hypothetical protein ABKN59_005339 [Abortiporus biennis]
MKWAVKDEGSGSDVNQPDHPFSSSVFMTFPRFLLAGLRRTFSPQTVAVVATEHFNVMRKSRRQSLTEEQWTT